MRQSGLSSSEATIPSTETKSANFFYQNLVNTDSSDWIAVQIEAFSGSTYLVFAVNLQLVHLNDLFVVGRKELEGLRNRGHT